MVIIVLVVAAAASGSAWLLHKRERFAGTDSVEPNVAIATLNHGQTLCVRDLLVPSNGDEIRFNLQPSGGTTPTVTMTLGTVARVRSTATRVLAQATYLSFPITRVPHASGGTACLRTSGTVGVFGSPALPATTRPQAFLDHKPLQARVAVWFVDKHPRSLLSMLGTAARRAAVFRAGFVGSWTYLLAALLLPLLWWLGLRTLLRSAE